MPDLLHEYWKGDEGDEFGVVQERSDHLRHILGLNARHIFSFWAFSWNRKCRRRSTAKAPP
jgi:hypothetical protein